MFKAPRGTLCDTLNTLFESPKEFLADVCFQFSSLEIWAHQAILLARAPKDFVNLYMPELLLPKKQLLPPLVLDISHIIPLDLFVPLLRFWYTSSFFKSAQSSVLNLPMKTRTNGYPELPPKEGSIYACHQKPDIQHEIEQLGLSLGAVLLPLKKDAVPDFHQLVNDFKRMRDDYMVCDVVIHLVSTENNTTLATFAAHRFILAVQSRYFYTLFCSSFQEASNDLIRLTNDLFNGPIIDLMLNFFYTGKIIVGPPDCIDKRLPPLQSQLQYHKHELRVIQKSYYVADFLSNSNTLGQALLHEMECLCHQFKCACTDCAVLLPSMLAWSDKNVNIFPQLRRALVLLYSDPVHSLAPLWSQKPFLHLISSIEPSTGALGEATLRTILEHSPLFPESAPKTVIQEIEELTFCNITKHNAIHVMHSLHRCISWVHSANTDKNSPRCFSLLDLLSPILKYTIRIVSQFFGFYCTEYPILISCVDGNAGGFSVGFLEFLLRHVLNDGISEINAGVIYQGIVHMCMRQGAIKIMAIGEVLQNARTLCAAYIADHWVGIKQKGGFYNVSESVMRQLAKDTNIRSLANSFDLKDFSSIFSFDKMLNKPEGRKSRQTSTVPALYKATFFARLL